MINQTEIITPRLILKSITPELIHHLFESKTKDEIVDYFAADEEGYNHLKSMHEKGMQTHRISHFYFLLIEKESQKVIGECGFHTWNDTHKRAELFYNMRNDSVKRKGYMTEALEAVIDFGFNNLQLHRIAAMTADWNVASLKLIHHFGFTKEGTMREDYVVNGKHENSECFSLLKHEWRK